MAGVRAVLDTNVVLAAHRSPNPASPNRELFERWRLGEFILLSSDDVLLEYAENMVELGCTDAEVAAFLARVQVLGEPVTIEFFHLRRYPADTDDIAFLLCAINGSASHLVTYDDGLLSFTGEYSFAICKPLVFLNALRTTAGSSP
jgi:predicted nucleic acid-binding protein